MYHIGKEQLNSNLCDHTKLENKNISSQFFDDNEIKQKEFYHCFFSNVSFKNSQLKDLTFLNCTFFNCYFKEAKMQKCKITGCRFINCNFRKLISPNDEKEKNIFQYSHFKNCYIEYVFIEKNLPEEPNISKEIIKNLEIETYQLGIYEEYLQYKLKRIELDEKQLWKAYRRADEWNKGHFTEKESKRAGWKWVYSKLMGVMWGHGEKFLPLFLSFFIFLCVFTILFKIVGNIEWHNAILASIENILSVNSNSIEMTNQSLAVRLVQIFQRIFSVLFLALFISLFTRRILRK